LRFLDKTNIILVGHYGSGKTELAYHLAQSLRQEQNRSVTLIDLDVANPFYKNTALKKHLTGKGVRLIAPEYQPVSADVTGLSPLIRQVVYEPEGINIFDVGGDEPGATVLGQFYEGLTMNRQMLDCLFVVNCMRPFTRKKDDILCLMSLITARSHIPITGLINNTNLSDETYAADLLHGQEILEEVSSECGIPIVMITGTENVIRNIPQNLQPLCVTFERVMRPEWNI